MPGNTSKAGFFALTLSNPWGFDAADLEQISNRSDQFDEVDFPCEQGEHRRSIWVSIEDFDAAHAEETFKTERIKPLKQQ